MTAGTFPQAWEEVAIVTIMRKGGTPASDAHNFIAITETIDLPQGDYSGESINNIAGGRIWKQTPEEDGEITLELYPTDVSVAANTGLFQQFSGTAASETYDSSQPLATNTTFVAGVYDAGRRQRDRFLIAIMWTDDTTQDNAIVIDDTGTTAKTALRFHVKEARITSHKAEFTDGVLKVTATFKYPAMNKAGTTRSWVWESSNDMLTAGTAELPDLTYA